MLLGGGMHFNFFSDEELTGTYQASIDILKRVGIRTDSGRFKMLLSDHGCKVDKDVVRFTDGAIEKGLQTVPAEFSLYGRNDHNRVRFGQGQIHTQTLVGAPAVIDLESGRKRDCTLQDVADIAQLSDALPFIDIVSPAFPVDVPPDVVGLAQLKTLLHCSSKPLRLCVKSADELSRMFDMLALVAGDRVAMRKKPQAYVEISPISPLTYGWEAAEALCEIVEAGLPLGIIPCPMMGATAPMSLAGCVAMHHAENLAGVVASQLLKPGAPVIMSPRATFMDMHSGAGLWAMPEMGMMAAASVQLCRKARVPCTATGYSTASKTTDIQSGYERLYNTLLPALGGADIIGSAGSLDNARISCYRMLVVDNEISSAMKRTVQGTQVDDEALAVNVIAEVFNARTHFLDHEHTYNNLRSPGLWVPPLGDRHTYQEWNLSAQRLEQKAAAEARRILKTHEVVPLDKDMLTELDRIIEGNT
jgi:trimethylamine--corrinoid protein Co-methyltransferase